jgi:uncharacterized surface protein with fasciclin (FAS1) repeats
MNRFFPSGQGGSSAVINPYGTSTFASGGAGGRRMLQQGVTSSGAATSTVPQTTTADTSSYAAAPSAGITSGGLASGSAAAPSGAAAGSCRTVAQIIQATPNLSVLRSLLPLLPADLRQYLNNAAGSQFTLFAPSDKAFQDAVQNIPDFAIVLDPRMLSGVAKSALGQGQPDVRALSALFAYHVVPNVAATSSQLKDGQVLPTALKGANLRVSINQAGMASSSSALAAAPSSAASSGAASSSSSSAVAAATSSAASSGVDIKGIGSTAAVTQADIQACRGVVHVVDSVLLPISLDSVMAGAPSQAASMQRQRQGSQQQQQQQQQAMPQQQQQVAAGGAG